MEVNGHFKTDRGRMRSINEDAGGIFYNKSGQLLAIVADGMGGHLAGEVASGLAVSIIKEHWEKIDEIHTPVEAENWLQEIISIMNTTIYNHASEKEEYDGMGTTVVVSVCTNDFVSIAHIGDSRCYLLNDTQFEQLTSDHSLVNELIRTGQITELDAEQHPRKNVLLKAVGTEETVQPDVETINWDSNNRVLLCSDGLTNKVSDDEIERRLRETEDIHSLVNEFIEIANERGGEDNITLAIIQKLEQDQEGDPTC